VELGGGGRREEKKKKAAEKKERRNVSHEIVGGNPIRTRGVFGCGGLKITKFGMEKGRGEPHQRGGKATE